MLSSVQLLATQELVAEIECVLPQRILWRDDLHSLSGLWKTCEDEKIKVRLHFIRHSLQSREKELYKYYIYIKLKLFSFTTATTVQWELITNR